MDLINKLIGKNIKTSELEGFGAKLRKQWEEVFAQHLTTYEKRNIHLHATGGTEGYLWHVFSYDKRACYKQQEAEKLFDQEHKEFCYIFFQHSDDVLTVEDATELKALDLLSDVGGYMDIYVVDQGFNWTFVVTHEKGWLGPYFSRK